MIFFLNVSEMVLCSIILGDNVFSSSIFENKVLLGFYDMLHHSEALWSFPTSGCILQFLRLKCHIRYSRRVGRELYFAAAAIRNVSWNFPLPLQTQNSTDFTGIDTITGSCICTQVWYLLIVKSALPATDLKSLPVKGRISFLTEIVLSLHKKSL